MRGWGISKLKRIFGSAQTRTTALLTLVIFLLIFSVALVSYYSSKSLLEKEIQQPQQALLQIDCHNTEQLLREMDDISLKVLINYTVRTEYEVSLQRRISEKIRLLTDLCSPNVESIYVYDALEETITASQPHGYYSNPVLFEDMDWLAGAEELLVNQDMLVTQRAVWESGKEQHVITLLRRIRSSGQNSGYIVVNARADSFFSNIDFDTGNSRVILDQYGEQLFLSAKGSERELILESLPMLRQATTDTLMLSSGEYLLTKLRSDYCGWTFYSLVRMEDVLSNLTIIRNVILCISFCAVLIGLYFIILLNQRLYRPIQRIGALIGQGSDATGRKPIDLDMIAAFTDKLIRSNEDLVETMEYDRLMLKTHLLEDILFRQLSHWELRRRWISLLPMWNDSPFYVAVLSIDRYYHWKSGYEQSDENLFKYSICNILDELTDQRFYHIRSQFTEDQVVYLLQPRGMGKTELADADAVAGALQPMLDTIGATLSISVSAGMSSRLEGIDSIPHGYTEARAALEARLYSGYASVNYLSGQEEAGSHAHFLDDKALDVIDSALRSGRIDIAREAVHNSCQYFRKSRMNPPAAKDYFQRVLGLLDALQVEPMDILDMNAANTMSLVDIEAQLDTAILNLVAGGGENRGSRNYAIAKQMLQYIRENYNRDIGVNDIARCAGLSLSTAGGIFKAETGMTIYDYLTGYRIEKACELLADASLSIAQVAARTGYQNEASFRRVFKKVKHVSPRNYQMILPRGHSVS